MSLFNLPHTAKVSRVIPKNAFDGYTNTKQKRLFTDWISRITWTHKLSTDTINLEAKEVKEIQIFHIELKVKEDIQPILDIVDKAIPYHIIFAVEFEGAWYLSTSMKHQHPINQDNAVLDWTFKTNWFGLKRNKYSLQLKGSIDAVYKDFCNQLSGSEKAAELSLPDLISYHRTVDQLKKEINHLSVSISKSKQFNDKVALNLKLKEKKIELDRLTKQ